MALRWPRNRLVTAFLLWGGGATVLFLAYEAVERVWLADLGSDARDAAHLARGILISLVTTMLTAAYLLRRVVPRLETSLEAATEPTRGREVPPASSLAAWLVGLRWVAVLALGAVVAFATFETGHVAAGSVGALWLGVGALAALNVLSSFLPSARLGRPGALVWQIAGDVAVLGWLVHHAGGLTNPFAGFFVFHAVLAGIVLQAPLARRMVVAIACFVLALTAVEASGLLPPVGLEGIHGSGRPWLHVGAMGMAVAIMVIGCALIVVALVRTLRDEHERLSRARGEVQAEREKLQSIIDCMADAVVFIGPDRTIQLRNRAADQLWPGGSPHGQDLRVCHPSGAWERLTRKLESPGAAELHPVIPVAGRSFEATMAPVSDAQGATAGVVMVARDITERIEKQKWQVDHERMAVVGKLAAGLAHEINNPLGAMVLFTQHALKGIAPDDPLADHLRTVLRNANLCKKIVKDLLEYARRRPPERVDVDLAGLMGDVTRTLSPGAERSGVRIDNRIEPEVPARLWGDPDQLRQVLVNLGLNAVEAMSSGGALTFVVRCPDRAHVAIDVTDTGPGIGPEDRERVFSAFFTTKPGGTGLGLAVARDLVAAHGGSLDFESEVGKGSTFKVLLPVSAAREAAA